MKDKKIVMQISTSENLKKQFKEIAKGISAVDVISESQRQNSSGDAGAQPNYQRIAHHIPETCHFNVNLKHSQVFGHIPDKLVVLCVILLKCHTDGLEIHTEVKNQKLQHRQDHQ